MSSVRNEARIFRFASLNGKLEFLLRTELSEPEILADVSVLGALYHEEGEIRSGETLGTIYQLTFHSPCTSLV